MTRPTLRDDMRSILVNRGYDNGVDPDVFEELLDELGEVVYERKGEF